MRLYIVTRNNEVIPVNAEPTDSILRLQALVVERQCLEFNNVILDHNRTIESYNIGNESLLHLNIRAQLHFKLYVRVFGGHTYIIKATRGDTLLTIKQKVQQQCQIMNTRDIILFHTGMLLEGDDRRLETFQIRNDCLLDLGFAMPSLPIAPNHGNNLPQQQQHQCPAPFPPQPFAPHHQTLPQQSHKRAKLSHPSPPSRAPVPAPTQVSAPAPVSAPTSVAVPTPVSAPIPVSTPVSASAPVSASVSAPIPAPWATAAPPPRPAAALVPKPATVPAPVRVTTTPALKPTATPPRTIMVLIIGPTKNLRVAINTAEKVSDLKRKISIADNTNTGSQTLTFHGEKMEDDSKISLYNINDGDTIELFARPRPVTKRKAPTSSSLPPSLSSSPSSFVSVKKEPPPPPTLNTTRYKGGSFAFGAIIDLLSSSDDDDDDNNNNNNNEPPPPPPPPSKKISLRVLPEGVIQSLDIPNSPSTVIGDILVAYDQLGGGSAKKTGKRTIRFGGVPLDAQRTLDELCITSSTILNLYIE